MRNVGHGAGDIAHLDGLQCGLERRRQRLQSRAEVLGRILQRRRNDLRINHLVGDELLHIRDRIEGQQRLDERLDVRRQAG